MHQDWIDKIPLLTGLDEFIDHDIQELTKCINACELSGDVEMADSYR